MTDFCSSYYVSNFFLIVEGVIGALILVGSFLFGSIFCIYAYFQNSKTAYKAAVILFSITLIVFTFRFTLHFIAQYLENSILLNISLKDLIIFLVILILPSIGIIYSWRKIQDISFIKLFSYLSLMIIFSFLTNIVIVKWEISKRQQHIENCLLDVKKGI